jgi:hypothetical protein
LLTISAKNKKIKSLERDIEYYRRRNLVNELQDKLRDPRFLSENTTNRNMVISTFFKQKFNELAVEKDRLNNENEDLKQKVAQLEERIRKGNFSDADETDNNMVMSSEMGEDEIQIYTYILIKNFEVLKYSNKKVEEVYSYDPLGTIQGF